MFRQPPQRRRHLHRVVALLFLFGPVFLTSAASPAARERSHEVQSVADRVKQQLGLDVAVTVELVAADRFLVSVEPPRGAGGVFTVRVEERLLDILDEDELEAALAHELGHVWVFTHHPFLQTELGANEIALRVVSRDTLARVYEKVWRDGGAKGTLQAFLGRRVASTAPQQ